MKKQDFLAELQKRLAGLPAQELDERLSFYSEAIDDRMEDGVSEEEAVAAAGSPEEIANQVISEIPLTRLVKQKVQRRRGLRAWEIVLLILGAPLWLPLVLTGLVVALSVYIVVWSLLISLWAIFASVTACAPYFIAAAVFHFTQGRPWHGLFCIGAALLCAGAAILLFFACRAATKAVLRGTKKVLLGVKSRLLRKEEAR